MDVMTGRVRNEWILVLLVCSISLRCQEEGFAGLCTGLFHMLLVLLLMLPIFAFRALGAADIKIFLSLSILFPLQGMLFLFISSLVIGALIGVLVLFYQTAGGRGQVTKDNRSIASQRISRFHLNHSVSFHYIHFTIPIFISVLLYEHGGVYELFIRYL